MGSPGNTWENLRNQSTTLRLVMNVANTPKISPLAPVGGCTSKSNSENEFVLGVHAVVSNQPTHTQVYRPEGK